MTFILAGKYLNQDGTTGVIVFSDTYTLNYSLTENGTSNNVKVSHLYSDKNCCLGIGQAGYAASGQTLFGKFDEIAKVKGNLASSLSQREDKSIASCVEEQLIKRDYVHDMLKIGVENENEVAQSNYLIMGMDHGKPVIFRHYKRWAKEIETVDIGAIGTGAYYSETINYINENYKENMTFDEMYDLLKTAFNISVLISQLTKPVDTISIQIKNEMKVIQLSNQTKEMIEENVRLEGCVVNIINQEGYTTYEST